jgi:FdhD protein
VIDALKDFEIVRVRDGRRVPAVDRAAAEEPLEVRLHGRPFAVIMRTPGADRELTAGFLLAERVVKSADDLGTIEYCSNPANEVRPTSDPANGRGHQPSQHPSNVINVTLAGGSELTIERVLSERRQVMTSSSCGLCGRLTIESLKSDVPPLTTDRRASASTVAALPDRLRAAQAVFDETGGLHAAGLFDPDGGLSTFAEDVGRHNAVDKVIGRMLMMDALPLADAILFVSGRASFEIVQKAFIAGIPIVGSVSAPSSLAIELAREAGITLACFVRGGSFNIYSHPERIE